MNGKKGQRNGGSTQSVQEMVTGRMITALQKGTVPWLKPWTAETGGIPRSMSTGKGYRGINTWLLTMTAMDDGYTSPWWGTFHRIKELGGNVRKGQHGTRVVWWKTITKPDPDDPSKTVSFMIGKTDVVFNACQADGLPEVYFPNPIEGNTEVIAEPETVLSEYLTERGPELVHAPQGRAYYQGGFDLITLPMREQFNSPQHYYGTAFHEAAHSTGHPKRLGRKGIMEWDHFGSQKYAREELVAEMGAAMLCVISGIDTTELFDNSAAYIKSWLKALENDVTLVGKAASEAQAATDYILGMVAADAEPVLEMAAA